MNQSPAEQYYVHVKYPCPKCGENMIGRCTPSGQNCYTIVYVCQGAKVSTKEQGMI